MGAHVELESLIKLQYHTRGFSFLPRQPIHSLLSGRHSSRVRGRGLDFEELRSYFPGDDIRTMDWHATARMRKPFLRVFTEERDRPAVIVLDQRINMFFGSRLSTKSVIAAEIGALGAWRVFHQGDRVGALLFNDLSVTEIKPQRSRSTVLRILNETVRQDRLLQAESPVRSHSAMLNEVLQRVSRIAQHDFTVLLVSDFDGANEATDDLLLALSRHNSVIAAFVYDPLSMQLPSSGELVASDGELQVEIPFGREHTRKSLLDASGARIQQILSWRKRFEVPVLSISTAEDTAAQLRHLLGQAAAVRRRT